MDGERVKTSEDALLCASCGYPAESLEAFPMGPKRPMEVKLLCEICAKTTIGRTVDCPGIFKDDNLAQAVAFIGNMILDTIDRRKKW